VSETPLVRAVLPRLAERIEAALRAQGEPRLADQVDSLRLTDVCRCDQPYCASFHTLDRPFKRWFLRGRQVEVQDGGPGEIVVDVVRGEIAYVEVLHLDDVREALAQLPSP
jgi:hypothetical protein